MRLQTGMNPGARAGILVVVRRRRPFAALVVLAGLAAGALASAPAHALFPNRTYSLDRLNTIVSPAMGTVDHNQPSAVAGYLVLHGNAKHEVWDIAEPFSPRKMAEVTGPHADGEAESHQISYVRNADGSIHLATVSGKGIDLWDFTDPTAPSLLSTVELEGIDYGDNTEAVWGIAWQGDFVWVGGTNTGLHVVDATDPRSPSVVTRIPVPELGGVSAGPVFAFGNVLVVTTPKNTAGIATLDIGDPRQPRLLDFVIPPQSSYIGGFYGRHAWLVDPLRAYDVTTDPSNIRSVLHQETEPSEYVSFGDGHLFLGRLRPDPGVVKLDVTDPARPRRVAEIPGRPVFFADDQFSVPIGNLLVISDDERKMGSVLAVHDTRADSAPPEVLAVHPPSGASGQPRSSRVGLSFSDQVDLTSIDGTTVVVRAVGGAALEGKWGLNHTLLSFWPSEPLAAETTYEIVLPAGGVRDLVGNPLAATFRSAFSTGTAVVAPTCELEPTSPTPTGATARWTARSAGPGATYRWDFGDGTTADGPLPSAEHAYAAPGRHPVTLTVSMHGATSSCSAVQVAHRPLEPTGSAASSTVALDSTRAAAWVVNTDAGTLAQIDLASGQRAREVFVGERPRTVTVAPDGSLWVAVQGRDEIVVLEGARPTVSGSIHLGHGAAPFGVAASPDARTVWVSLEASGVVVAIDVASREVVARIALESRLASPRPKVRSLVVSGDSERVFVGRSVSASGAGEVFEVSATSMTQAGTITLEHDDSPDEQDQGRGVPNYLGAMALSPDGARLLVPSKKDNTERGSSRDGLALTPDNTVRTIVAQIDVSGGSEVRELRTDLDDHDLAAAIAFSRSGDLVFVASQGTNKIDVLDAYTGRLVAGFATDLAPQGLVLTEDGQLLVHCATTRTLDVFDVRGLLDGSDARARRLTAISTVGDEPLSAVQLLGQQLFHNADNPEMSLSGYTSCASCHLDGGEDGRVWDFTDRGEGLRNTITLRGRAGTGHGPVHWTGNFDEIQDFEHDIRAHFGGSGLMADDLFEMDGRDRPLGAPKAGLSARLDALSAYVSSFRDVGRSPYREADGTLSAAAERGRRTFVTLDCVSCHAGPSLTDSAVGVLHDVGTLGARSGKRLGEPLTGLDTPTLLGLWETAPYLHDGSAPTLHDVLMNERHGNAWRLDPERRDDVVSFLLQLESPNDLGEAHASVGPRGGCACRAAGDTSGQGTLLPWVACAVGAAARRRRSVRRGPA